MKIHSKKLNPGVYVYAQRQRQDTTVMIREICDWGSEIEQIELNGQGFLDLLEAMNGMKEDVIKRMDDVDEDD